MTALEKIYADPDITAKYQDLRQDDTYYYFYKHFTIDTDQYVLDMFKNSTLRLRRSTTFNDPYDCYSKINIHPELKQREIHEAYHHAIIQNGIQLHYGGVDGFNTTEVIKHYVDSKIRLLQQPWDIIRLNREKVFLTSFNNSPENLLMWSHYADQYRGFMVEFKIPKIHHLGLLPLPVEYSNHLKETELNFPILYDCWQDERCAAYLKNSFLVKAKDWHYEKEFRLFANQLTPTLSMNDTFDIQIPPHFFNSIILGERLAYDRKTTNTFIQKIEEANQINGTSIKIYQSRINENEYKIDFKHPIIGN